MFFEKTYFWKFWNLLTASVCGPCQSGHLKKYFKIFKIYHFGTETFFFWKVFCKVFQTFSFGRGTAQCEPMWCGNLKD
jgi:hypothetical protein